MIFKLGMCLLIHGYEYEIVVLDNDVVANLKQEVFVQDEWRAYHGWWKTSYLEKEAKETHCSKSKIKK